MINELEFAKGKMVCVRSSETDIAVVGVDREGYICHKCCYGRHSCRHICCLKEYLEECKEELPDVLLDFEAYHEEMTNSIPNAHIRKAVSTQLIPINTSSNQQSIYRFPNDFVQAEDGGYPLLATDKDKCPVCSSDFEQCLNWLETDTRLFLLFKIVSVHGI